MIGHFIENIKYYFSAFDRNKRIDKLCKVSIKYNILSYSGKCAKNPVSEICV